MAASAAPVVAVIAPGAMGSAVGRRLSEHGARVLTSIDGRSRASADRAEAAGMVPAGDDRIAAEADYVLSIVPPDNAVDLARRLGAVFRQQGRHPLFVDCNAINPDTVRSVQDALGASDDTFVDASIVGPPPKPGSVGPTFYLSGPSAGRFAVLEGLGLRIHVLAEPVGAASALKMCYGAITKGFVAIGAAAVLAVSRAGLSHALAAELVSSAPALSERLGSSLPTMLPKAYRWDGEMEQVAAFIGDAHAEHGMFTAAAALYARLAAQVGEGAAGDEAAILSAFAALVDG